MGLILPTGRRVNNFSGMDFIVAGWQMHSDRGRGYNSRVWYCTDILQAWSAYLEAVEFWPHALIWSAEDCEVIQET